MNSAFEKHLDSAGRTSLELIDVLRSMDVRGYLEESGQRGYHIWVFFSEWISIRYINFFSDAVLSRMNVPDDILIECFPNKTRLKTGKARQVIKLPYGVHIATGKNSRFLNSDMSVVKEPEEFVRDMVSYSLNEIKRIVTKYAKIKIEKEKAPEIALSTEDRERLPDNIVTTLEKCSLMRYLYHKAKTTGYLPHSERLSLLYVFGHIGIEGKEFVHTVMEFTINYSYNVTQRFIDRLPEKPVSCGKLQDQYKQVTAKYGCGCRFKRTPNCYPSPVLHAHQA